MQIAVLPGARIDLLVDLKSFVTICGGFFALTVVPKPSEYL